MVQLVIVTLTDVENLDTEKLWAELWEVEDGKAEETLERALKLEDIARIRRAAT